MFFLFENNGDRNSGGEMHTPQMHTTAKAELNLSQDTSFLCGWQGPQVCGPSPTASQCVLSRNLD